MQQFQTYFSRKNSNILKMFVQTTFKDSLGAKIQTFIFYVYLGSLKKKNYETIFGINKRCFFSGWRNYLQNPVLTLALIH